MMIINKMSSKHSIKPKTAKAAKAKPEYYQTDDYKDASTRAEEKKYLKFYVRDDVVKKSRIVTKSLAKHLEKQQAGTLPADAEHIGAIDPALRIVFCRSMKGFLPPTGVVRYVYAEHFKAISEECGESAIDVDLLFSIIESTDAGVQWLAEKAIAADSERQDAITISAKSALGAVNEYAVSKSESPEYFDGTVLAFAAPMFAKGSTVPKTVEQQEDGVYAAKINPSVVQASESYLPIRKLCNWSAIQVQLKALGWEAGAIKAFGRACVKKSKTYEELDAVEGLATDAYKAAKAKKNATAETKAKAKAARDKKIEKAADDMARLDATVRAIAGITRFRSEEEHKAAKQAEGAELA